MKDNRNLKTIWAEEMKLMPVIETKESVIYLQPSEDGKHIEYGTMTNGGLLPNGRVEYDFDLSLDVNIQGLADTIFDEFGYPSY